MRNQRLRPRTKTTVYDNQPFMPTLQAEYAMFANQSNIQQDP